MLADVGITDFVISIHALREEGDLVRLSHGQPGRLFLSTPSARRATTSTRSVAGANRKISIHALREEGDCCWPLLAPNIRVFLSTPSARRATAGNRQAGFLYQISIHALREEGDGRRQSWALSSTNFYPRPPRGGRRMMGKIPGAALRFLSTPSARRATIRCANECLAPNISIHALREEGDRQHQPRI